METLKIVKINTVKTHLEFHGPTYKAIPTLPICVWELFVYCLAVPTTRKS